MNITELARVLKITPNELRENLPKLGFDIGQKAIKINKNVANQIIKNWPRLRRQLAIEKELEQEKKEAEAKKYHMENKQVIHIAKFITVREISALTNIPVNKIIAELMKNGIFASLNEKIDFDTAWLIGEELGFEIKHKDEKDEETTESQEDKLKEKIEKEDKNALQKRPPVIVVMGHVDHGKTKLLDSIRESNVVAGEAGGITQHIGAYQIEKNNKKITFIDTPGHEAFTAMRSRGAKIADIAILVVAADDGVKPQTVEAYRIIEKAGLPIIVAINKIDKPEANIDKTKQELSTQLGLTPEDWGGKTIMVPISAQNKTGLDDLVDMILLLDDVEAEKMKANPDADAVGSVIESHIDKAAGPVATILIQNGTLKVGDKLSFNEIDYGKVRALYDYNGQKVNQAKPSDPVKIIGLKLLPEVGDLLEVGVGKKIKAKNIKSINRQKSQVAGNESEDDGVEKINLIIKSDVLGSAEAIEESLEKINTNKIKNKIVHKGLGNVNEGDIARAESTNSQILCFNVKTPPKIMELARDKNIKIRTYNVIYDLINDIKEEMKTLIKPEEERHDIGSMEVLAVFRTESKRQIFGGKIKEGKAEKDCLMEVVRQGKIIDRGKMLNLKSGKQEVSDVMAGEECGIEYEGQIPVEVGDNITFYKMKEIIPEN